jgi:hypothetical protein
MYVYLLYHHQRVSACNQAISLCNDVKTAFNVFMSKFTYYFKRAFPQKTIYMKDQYENKWITQGLNVPSKRM